MLLLEIEDREFGVVLEGVERLMAEPFLDVVQVGPAAATIISSPGWPAKSSSRSITGTVRIPARPATP